MFLSKAFHVCPQILTLRMWFQTDDDDDDDDEVCFNLMIFYEAVMDGFGIIESRS